MATFEKKLLERNKMTAREVINKYGTSIDFIENPQRPGHLFFSVGTKTGFIGPKVLQAFKDGNLKTEEVMYVECCKPDVDSSVESNWVPCLMLISKANVKGSLK